MNTLICSILILSFWDYLCGFIIRAYPGFQTSCTPLTHLFSSHKILLSLATFCLLTLISKPHPQSDRPQPLSCYLHSIQSVWVESSPTVLSGSDGASDPKVLDDNWAIWTAQGLKAEGS